MGDLNAANRYVYADDNPVNATDPSGKAVTLSCLFNFVGGVIGTIGGIGGTVLAFVVSSQAYSAAYEAAIAQGATEAAATAAAESAAIVPFGIGVFAGLIAVGAIFVLIGAILSCNGQ